MRVRVPLWMALALAGWGLFFYTTDPLPFGRAALAWFAVLLIVAGASQVGAR